MTDPIPATPIDEPLPRKFGFWTGLFVVVASMVGSGILTTSGFTLRATESVPTLLLLWGIGGVLALCGSLTIAELATCLPRVGGEYVILREAFGKSTAFVYGWATLIVGFAGPTAVIALAAADYLITPWKTPAGELPAGEWLNQALATSFIVLFTWSHCLGQRQSAWVQVSTTIVKLAILIGLVLFGFAIGQGSWSHIAVGRPIAEQQAGLLGISLIYVMYSYSGWNGAVYLAGEIHDPPRLLPRCLIGGCALVTLLYLSLNLTYAYALDPRQLATMTNEQVQPIADLAARHLFGTGISRPLAFLIGLGILSSVSAYILTGPRVSFAMARDGLFPRYAGWLHPVRNTPIAATVTQGLVSLILLLWMDTFEDLLKFTGVGLAALAGLTIASIFPLRHRADLPHPFRLPFYPIPPLVFLALTVGSIGFAFYQDPITTRDALGSMLIGYPIYYLFLHDHRRPNVTNR